MKKEYTLSVFTENKTGLLTRVAMIFTRRKVNIESITASKSEVEDVYRYTIVIQETEEMVAKIAKQIEKQVDVHFAFYHENEEIVCQEIALYKMKTDAFSASEKTQLIVRDHNVRVLEMNQEFTILEKTGHREETQEVFDELQPLGVLEFVRSGRVAISKPMKELKDYLKELETEAKLN